MPPSPLKMDTYKRSYKGNGTHPENIAQCARVLHTLQRILRHCFHLNITSRFSPERKANRNPAAFLAFGVGPRNCVGMRFALLESKLALARILQKYNIEKCPESAEVLVTTEQATVVPKNGVMVKLALRN